MVGLDLIRNAYEAAKNAFPSKINKLCMVSDFFSHLHAKKPRFYVKVDFRHQIDVKNDVK